MIHRLKDPANHLDEYQKATEASPNKPTIKAMTHIHLVATLASEKGNRGTGTKRHTTRGEKASMRCARGVV